MCQMPSCVRSVHRPSRWINPAGRSDRGSRARSWQSQGGASEFPASAFDDGAEVDGVEEEEEQVAVVGWTHPRPWTLGL